MTSQQPPEGLSAEVIAAKSCTLAQCPPGPFLFDGQHLGFKTEYRAMDGKDVGGGKVEWAVGQRTEAYVMASGEFFVGGASTSEAREALVVTPVDPDGLLSALNAARSTSWRTFLASDMDWLADHGRKMGPGVGQQAIERLLCALQSVAAGSGS